MMAFGCPARLDQLLNHGAGLGRPLAVVTATSPAFHRVCVVYPKSNPLAVLQGKGLSADEAKNSAQLALRTSLTERFLGKLSVTLQTYKQVGYEIWPSADNLGEVIHFCHEHPSLLVSVPLDDGADTFQFHCGLRNEWRIACGFTTKIVITNLPAKFAREGLGKLVLQSGRYSEQQVQVVAERIGGDNAPDLVCVCDAIIIFCEVRDAPLDLPNIPKCVYLGDYTVQLQVKVCNHTGEGRPAPPPPPPPPPRVAVMPEPQQQQPVPPHVAQQVVQPTQQQQQVQVQVQQPRVQVQQQQHELFSSQLHMSGSPQHYQMLQHQQQLPHQQSTSQLQPLLHADVPGSIHGGTPPNRGLTLTPLRGHGGVPLAPDNSRQDAQMHDADRTYSMQQHNEAHMHAPSASAAHVHSPSPAAAYAHAHTARHGAYVPAPCCPNSAINGDEFMHPSDGVASTAHTQVHTAGGRCRDEHMSDVHHTAAYTSPPGGTALMHTRTAGPDSTPVYASTSGYGTARAPPHGTTARGTAHAPPLAHAHPPDLARHASASYLHGTPVHGDTRGTAVAGCVDDHMRDVRHHAGPRVLLRSAAAGVHIVDTDAITLPLPPTAVGDRSGTASVSKSKPQQQHEQWIAQRSSRMPPPGRTQAAATTQPAAAPQPAPGDSARSNKRNQKKQQRQRAHAAAATEAAAAVAAAVPQAQRDDTDMRSVSSYGAGSSGRDTCSDEIQQAVDAGLRAWRTFAQRNSVEVCADVLRAGRTAPTARYKQCALSGALHEHLQDNNMGGNFGMRQCMLNFVHDRFRAAWQLCANASTASDVPCYFLHAVTTCADDIARDLATSAEPVRTTRSAAAKSARSSDVRMGGTS